MASNKSKHPFSFQDISDLSNKNYDEKQHALRCSTETNSLNNAINYPHGLLDQQKEQEIDDDHSP